MNIEDICKRFGFTSLILFGSATHNMTTAEDVDVCYTGKSKLTTNAYFECIELLKSLFEKEKIDLVYWSSIPSALKKEIADNYRILYTEGDVAMEHINMGEQMFWDEKKYYDLLFEKMKAEFAQ